MRDRVTDWFSFLQSFRREVRMNHKMGAERRPHGLEETNFALKNRIAFYQLIRYERCDKKWRYRPKGQEIQKRGNQ